MLPVREGGEHDVARVPALGPQEIVGEELGRARSCRGGEGPTLRRRSIVRVAHALSPVPASLFGSALAIPRLRALRPSPCGRVSPTWPPFRAAPRAAVPLLDTEGLRDERARAPCVDHPGASAARDARARHAPRARICSSAPALGSARRSTTAAVELGASSGTSRLIRARCRWRARSVSSATCRAMPSTHGRIGPRACDCDSNARRSASFVQSSTSA